MSWQRICAAVCVSVVTVTPARAQTSRILVMPFENAARDSRIVWLSEASAVLLAGELEAVGQHAIARDERRAAFERLRVPPAVSLTDATVIRIGRLLAASEVVVGTVRLDDEGTLHVQARSIALESGRIRHTADERGPLADLFQVFERVSSTLAGVPSRPSPNRPPVVAFEQYIKGLLAATPATALSYLTQARTLAPTFVAPLLAEWDVHTDQGAHARALEAVNRVPEGAAEFERAQFRAGLSLMTLDRHADAFTVFKALADRRPTAAVLNNLGVIQLRRGGTPSTGSAAYYFTMAADADPRHPDTSFNLGYAYWREGNADAAIYWLRQAVRRDPADEDAHAVLGAALQRSGNAAEARRELDLAQRLSSDYAGWESRPPASLVPNGLERISTDVALPDVWRVDAALSDSTQRDQRELAQFYLDRSRRLFADQRGDEALEELRRTLFLSPYDADAHILAGRIHLRAGRVADAIGALQIALWSAESAEAHAVLAAAHLEGDDLEAARAEARRALALDPDLAEAWMVLDQVDRE